MIRCEEEMMWYDVKQRWWCDKMWSGEDDMIWCEVEIMMWSRDDDDVTTCEAEMMWCKAMMMIR